MEYANIYSCAEHVHNYLKDKGIECNCFAVQNILFRTYVEFAVRRHVKIFEENFCAWEHGFVIPDLYSCYKLPLHPKFNLSGYKPLTNNFLKYRLELMADEFIPLAGLGNYLSLDSVSDKIKSQELYKKHANGDMLTMLSTPYCDVTFEEIKEYYSKKENYTSLLSCYEVENCSCDSMEK